MHQEHIKCPSVLLHWDSLVFHTGLIMADQGFSVGRGGLNLKLNVLPRDLGLRYAINFSEANRNRDFSSICLDLDAMFKSVTHYKLHPLPHINLDPKPVIWI